MIRRFFARRRLIAANANWRSAYDEHCRATERQDTRRMGTAAAELRRTNHERLAAENALAKLEGWGGLGRAF